MQHNDGEDPTDQHLFDRFWPSDQDERPKRASKGVIGLAVAPWIIVAGMVFGAFGGRSVPAEPSEPPPGHVEHDDLATGPHPSDMPLSGQLADPYQPSATRHNATQLDRHITGRLAAAGATAAVAARAWLTGVEPHLTAGGMAPGNERWYVEHLAVESVEPFNDELAVATVLAIVLGGSDELDVHLRRVAVPVWLAPSVEPASAPWWLPEPDWDIVPLETHRVEDPQLLEHARQALQRHGYRDVRIVSLERSPRWPWLVRAEATTPAGERLSTPVFLYEDAHGFSVATPQLNDAVTPVADTTQWGTNGGERAEVQR